MLRPKKWALSACRDSERQGFEWIGRWRNHKASIKSSVRSTIGGEKVRIWLGTAYKPQKPFKSKKGVKRVARSKQEKSEFRRTSPVKRKPIYNRSKTKISYPIYYHLSCRLCRMVNPIRKIWPLSYLTRHHILPHCGIHFSWTVVAPGKIREPYQDVAPVHSLSTMASLSDLFGQPPCHVPHVSPKDDGPYWS